MTIEFKEKFIERYKQLTDWDVYAAECKKRIRKAIRVNTLKISIKDLKKRLEAQGFTLTQVPWCKEGFWIVGDRTDLGNLLEHALGYFYVQEASSMIPPVVLDPEEHDSIVDVAAAPGSKTTQIGQYLNNTGIIIANDVAGNRLASLGINIQRMGLKNAIVTKMQGQNIKGQFDKILLDAPCSGTGTIMKSLAVVTDWNVNLAERLSQLQRKLITNSFNSLRPGGVMVYSTCTMEPQENEGVISWLLEKFPDAKLEEIKLNIKRSPAILKFEKEVYNPEVSKCLRIWPQDNNTEGFFVAKIRKE
ncbi:MAG TPA: RsmB/NOP family class I SAM-dependent RNA methyltransferase [Candidatus Nanoarchaeia archaeon]|nr:RsmB/NOP family class I SAM-dependent RNA methyltransferase [Candidatus Nanoarchaeia archaeon]